METTAETMDDLRSRVLTAARLRISAGMWSERQLARVAQISQPHLHHALAGKRQLSIDFTDRLIWALRLDLMALGTEHRQRPRLLLLPLAA